MSQKLELGEAFDQTVAIAVLGASLEGNGGNSRLGFIGAAYVAAAVRHPEWAVAALQILNMESIYELADELVEQIPIRSMEQEAAS